MAVDVGFTLHPDDEYLARCAPLWSLADYFEVAPETTWFAAVDGTLLENGYHRRFRAIGDAHGASFVAHGVGYSVGTEAASDAPRRARWIARMAEDQRAFAYRWYTDHLGATSLDGRSVTLPLPVPMTNHAAAVVRARLEEMRAVVADVGVENSVPYFTLGDPLDEPLWLRKCICAPGHHLLLDLHNVHTMAVNLGFDADEWLERADLSRVIEIHVSGGSPSDPSWLPSKRQVRLDAHDTEVPEPVWALLERWAPRCRHLRGITLERMEGTVGSEDDVEGLRAELERVRSLAEGLDARAERGAVAHAALAEAAAAEPEAHRAFERAMAAAIRADDPLEALRAAAGALPDELAERIRAADEDGVRIAALLVAKLRFERLLRGNDAIAAFFESDPRGFGEAFRRYHAETPMNAFFPPDEAAAFAAWWERRV